MHLSAVLGLSYLISEVLLACTRRAGSGTTADDANSLRVLWLVIGFSVFLGIKATFWWPTAGLLHPKVCASAALTIFVAGLVLRWFSIIWLGRFFTVNVAIASDHQLIDSGPYRLIRHPSYTGALLAFLGFGLSLGNWAALLMLIVPITLAFAYRIKVEERALRAALGERYEAYCRRTKRLVPFVY